MTQGGACTRACSHLHVWPCGHLRAAERMADFLLRP